MHDPSVTGGSVRRDSDTIDLDHAAAQLNKLRRGHVTMMLNLYQLQIGLAAICLGLAVLVAAQEAKAGDSPLDTLLSTRVWADVPEAKDFVRESRPPPESLAYQPVTGPDRTGPELRSQAELKALETELESAAAHNVRSAERRLGYRKPSAAKSAKREEIHAINSANR